MRDDSDKRSNLADGGISIHRAAILVSVNQFEASQECGYESY
jgi:hypothetical protein